MGVSGEFGRGILVGGIFRAAGAARHAKCVLEVPVPEIEDGNALALFGGGRGVEGITTTQVEKSMPKYQRCRGRGYHMEFAARAIDVDVPGVAKQ